MINVKKKVQATACTFFFMLFFLSHSEKIENKGNEVNNHTRCHKDRKRKCQRSDRGGIGVLFTGLIRHNIILLSLG